MGNRTLIAGLSCNGIVAPWVISGALDRDAFDTYIEKVQFGDQNLFDVGIEKTSA